MPLLAPTVTWFTIALLGWLLLAGIVGGAALPGGPFFAMFVLVVVADAGGLLLDALGLPSLVGMLGAGLILASIPGVHLAEESDADWSNGMRSVAVAVIMIRAGLGIQIETLRRLGAVCLRIAFIPNLVEAFVVAGVCMALFGLSFSWGLVGGFVLSGVSPAVIIPEVLHLQDAGYGVQSGVPSALLAAVSVDNVLSICGIGVALSLSMQSGDPVLAGFLGPIQLIGGGLAGLAGGLVLANWLPLAPADPSRASWMQLRAFSTAKPASETSCFAALFVCGVTAVLGTRQVKLPSAGVLFVIVMSFAAAQVWRHQLAHTPEQSKVGRVGTIAKEVWRFCQPPLYVFIGASVNLSVVDGNDVGKAIAIIVAAVAVRSLLAVGAAWTKQFSRAETVFVALALSPKATVQAAFGGVALEALRLAGEEERPGEVILLLAVLSIVVTAPIGALVIAKLGPRLLTRAESADAAVELV